MGNPATAAFWPLTIALARTPRAQIWRYVISSVFSTLGALLYLATAAAPAALASSSTAAAQTPTPPSVLSELSTNEATHQTAPLAVATVDQRHVECVAKVIMHEAAYEPRPGRIAVAQVIRARVRSGRFASDACAVTRQRGQFFDVDAFDPPRNAAWNDAVAIAAETLQGEGEDLVPGALFFHASYSPMPGHARVGQIGGHVFYR